MIGNEFSQNLPDDADTLKALFYLCADQFGQDPNKRKQVNQTLKAISEKIIHQTDLEKFRGSSEMLSDQNLRQIGLMIAQAAATEHAAGQIIAVSESGPFDPQITKAWTSSRTQLQERLTPHVPESILYLLKSAIALRNEVAHRFQSEITHTETYKLLGLPVDGIAYGERITVKRN